MSDTAGGLVVSAEGGVLRLRLNRPDKRNAIDDAMMRQLIDEIEAAGQDESVRVIVLSGAGDHFCGGADIIARNAKPSANGSGSANGNGGAAVRPRAGSIQRRLPTTAHRLIPLVQTVQTPVVCAVRGWAAGIGLALALAADITVTTADATFWAPFADRGFTPDSGLSWLLQRRVGEVRARRMLLLGEKVTGADAAQWGLVDRAVPATDLDGAVEEIVAELAGAATVAVGLTKWLLAAGATAELDDQLRNEAFALELSSRSEDFREGLGAFREKRRPRFSGR
ncbi:2-(1,2-epoxy-1,2-dihydrophenyl)acetyl-CoA isomerase [Parafrankia irregularis]|uniref:2-(1,2-epoxy-1,2-dihydrophenyl)acetyl-CoA isomerase n=1 Tax=Parafrankia irregularis TaxID=795642 RepID=A0A0S4QI78_9ACTN|nr:MULTISPECIES: enoyl-CoA hydratase-related protein [Parafrankia]MBE3200806.1 enoyl-CoA hydratase/isomerase family protein [Parafrankia sp. CH37]CUU54802.1 2-(1,2-epoxy-1,2-dihydrophenyl)acetyl-CoA isomerase [Parafrankia irregularis]